MVNEKNELANTQTNIFWFSAYEEFKSSSDELKTIISDDNFRKLNLIYNMLHNYIIDSLKPDEKSEEEIPEVSLEFTPDIFCSIYILMLKLNLLGISDFYLPTSMLFFGRMSPIDKDYLNQNYLLQEILPRDISNHIFGYVNSNRYNPWLY